MNPVEYAAPDYGVEKSCISHGSLDVVERLQRAGFDGYLVGGCVRDLVLGRVPKDFDVATNAHPEQVRKVLNRARIIGRRFKLVHVHYGRGRERETVEIATYRAGSPGAGGSGDRKKTSSTGRLLDDNVYGTLEQDVLRRDFTVNALYYDPVTETILDFVGAMEDVRAQRLSMIGDVTQRFTEDPVRMLRAIRFQAKLGLEPHTEVVKGIADYADLLLDVPPARMFEEVLKLFHHGAAVDTWKLLCRSGLANRVFPQTLSDINDKGGHRLEVLIIRGLANTDKRINQDLPVIPAFLFSLLLWRSYCRELERLLGKQVPRNEAHWLAGEKVFKQQARTVTVPWRAKGPALDIWDLQFALESRVPRKIGKILDHKRFRAAYDFLWLRADVAEVTPDLVDWWTNIQDESPEFQRKMIDELRGSQPATRQRKRRRPRKRRKNTQA